MMVIAEIKNTGVNPKGPRSFDGGLDDPILRLGVSFLRSFSKFSLGHCSGSP